MLQISLCQLKPKTGILAGAALGEKHGQQIAAMILIHSGHKEVAVLLDFRDVHAVTPSYLKQTLPPLYGGTNTDPSAPRTVPLYCNLSSSAEDDVHHFLLAQRLPGLVVQLKSSGHAFQKRIGLLEATANETLFRLSGIHAGSAADLMATTGGSAIALTAWNNRLAELFRLRLATREKRGRHWIYKPIVEVKNNG